MAGNSSARLGRKIMFSAEFDYHKASSVAEAIQLLGAHPNAK